MKTLSSKEKELIGIILDYEKEHLRRTYAVADAMGLPADACDMVPFDRLKSALGLNDEGDVAIDVIYGYTNDTCTLDDVFNVIEYVANKETKKVHDWCITYGFLGRNSGGYVE